MPMRGDVCGDVYGDDITEVTGLTPRRSCIHESGCSVMRMVSLLSEDKLRMDVAEAHDVLEQCSDAATPPWGGVTSRLVRYAGTWPKPRRLSQSISGTFPGHG
jgi:hypothetical protein